MSYKDFDLIKEVVLTEKAFKLGQGGRVYVVKVDPKANKTSIKEALERIFEVKVEKVRTLNFIGKRKMNRKGEVGYRPNFKKAYITLAPGYSLPLFDQV